MFSRKSKTSQGGFTLIEALCAGAAFSFFATALLLAWTMLGTSSLNTISYCRSENDQMRTFDYLRRDIRRASQVQIITGGTVNTTTNVYSGGSVVSGTGSLILNNGNMLQITLLQYYNDTQQEDAIGFGRLNYSPTLDSNSKVAYGTTTSGSTVTANTITVQYYISNGVIMHSELQSQAGAVQVVRAISDGGSVDSLLFWVDPTTNLIDCHISYTQTMRSVNNRTLKRVVDILCGQHATL